MPFKPGHKKIGGRKPGSLNKATIDNLKLQVWFDRIAQDVELLEKPEQRIAIGLQMVDRILSKTANMPGNPGESVENAAKLMETMKELETTNDNAGA